MLIAQNVKGQWIRMSFCLLFCSVCFCMAKISIVPSIKIMKYCLSVHKRDRRQNPTTRRYTYVPIDVIHGFLFFASSVVEKNQSYHTLWLHTYAKKLLTIPFRGATCFATNAKVMPSMRESLKSWGTILTRDVWTWLSESILMWIFISWKPSVLARSLHDTFYSRIPKQQISTKSNTPCWKPQLFVFVEPQRMRDRD